MQPMLLELIMKESESGLLVTFPVLVLMELKILLQVKVEQFSRLIKKLSNMLKTPDC